MSWLLADVWYMCKKHKIPYPRGAKCPKCEKEKENNNAKQ